MDGNTSINIFLEAYGFTQYADRFKEESVKTVRILVLLKEADWASMNVRCGDRADMQELAIKLINSGKKNVAAIQKTLTAKKQAVSNPDEYDDISNFIDGDDKKHEDVSEPDKYTGGYIDASSFPVVHDDVEYIDVSGFPSEHSSAKTAPVKYIKLDGNISDFLERSRRIDIQKKDARDKYIRLIKDFKFPVIEISFILKYVRGKIIDESEENVIDLFIDKLPATLLEKEEFVKIMCKIHDQYEQDPILMKIPDNYSDDSIKLIAKQGDGIPIEGKISKIDEKLIIDHELHKLSRIPEKYILCDIDYEKVIANNPCVDGLWYNYLAYQYLVKHYGE